MTLELQSFTQPKKLTLPGPRGLPIVGMLPFMGKYLHVRLTNLAKKYGDVFQIQMGARSIVVLNHVNILKQALLKQGEDFAGRPGFYLMQVAAQGLAIGSRDYSPLWKKHRGIVGEALAKFFTSEATFIDQQVREEATELANIFLSYGGQPFDPKLETALAFGSVVVRILFGEKDAREDRDFVNLLRFGAPYFSENTANTLFVDFLPQFPIFYQHTVRKFERGAKMFDSYALKKLKEHQDSYDPLNLRDMTDALLKADSKLNVSEKQTLDILGGSLQEVLGSGVDTIPTTLRWALLYMIVYPELQAQVQQEIDQVIGTKQQVSFKDRTKLPFTQACIYETLRYSPPLPLGLPHATTTDTFLNGYFIPKNTPVLINLYSSTRDKRYWKEPEKFNPYRFLNTSGEVREDLLDQYYPFGLGKRRCLGEYLSRFEIFIFFANLMHKCKFESVPGEKLNLNSIPGISIEPKKFKIIVKPRF